MNGEKDDSRSRYNEKQQGRIIIASGSMLRRTTTTTTTNATLHYLNNDDYSELYILNPEFILYITTTTPHTISSIERIESISIYYINFTRFLRLHYSHLYVSYIVRSPPPTAGPTAGPRRRTPHGWTDFVVCSIHQKFT
jgi:hypothetical protein